MEPFHQPAERVPRGVGDAVAGQGKPGLLGDERDHLAGGGEVRPADGERLVLGEVAGDRRERESLPEVGVRDQGESCVSAGQSGDQPGAQAGCERGDQPEPVAGADEVAESHGDHPGAAVAVVAQVGFEFDQPVQMWPEPGRAAQAGGGVFPYDDGAREQEPFDPRVDRRSTSSRAGSRKWVRSALRWPHSELHWPRNPESSVDDVRQAAIGMTSARAANAASTLRPRNPVAPVTSTRVFTRASIRSRTHRASYRAPP